jgi:short subunit fatty acids transporter
VPAPGVFSFLALFISVVRERVVEDLKTEVDAAWVDGAWNLTFCPLTRLSTVLLAAFPCISVT